MGAVEHNAMSIVFVDKKQWTRTIVLGAIAGVVRVIAHAYEMGAVEHNAMSIVYVDNKQWTRTIML